MLEKCALTILGLNWNQCLRHKKTKINICDHMLTSSTQLQNSSFYIVERTRTSSKCQKMKNARAKRAKILFFIVKYANLWGFCCRCRRGCLSSLLTTWSDLFCGFMSDFNALQQIFIFFFLSPNRSYKFNSTIVSNYFTSQTTWNDRGMITEKWSC